MSKLKGDSKEVQESSNTMLNLEHVSPRSTEEFYTETLSDTDTIVYKPVKVKKRQPMDSHNSSFSSSKDTVKNQEEEVDFQEINIEAMEKNWAKFDYELSIKTVNDSGTYQKTIMIAGVVCLFGCSFTSYILGFIAADPVTYCL